MVEHDGGHCIGNMRPDGKLGLGQCFLDKVLFCVGQMDRGIHRGIPQCFEEGLSVFVFKLSPNVGKKNGLVDSDVVDHISIRLGKEVKEGGSGTTAIHHSRFCFFIVTHLLGLEEESVVDLAETIEVRLQLNLEEERVQIANLHKGSVVIVKEFVKCHLAFKVQSRASQKCPGLGRGVVKPSSHIAKGTGSKVHHQVIAMIGVHPSRQIVFQSARVLDVGSFKQSIGKGVVLDVGSVSW